MWEEPGMYMESTNMLLFSRGFQPCSPVYLAERLYILLIYFHGSLWWEGKSGTANSVQEAEVSSPFNCRASIFSLRALTRSVILTYTRLAPITDLML